MIMINLFTNHHLFLNLYLPVEQKNSTLTEYIILLFYNNSNNDNDNNNDDDDDDDISAWIALSTSHLHHQLVGLDGNFFDDCLRNHFYSYFIYFINLVLLFFGS